MSSLRRNLIGWCSLILLCGAPAAHAQFAVIDIGAIVQLIQEVSIMEQQVETAKQQLSQARSELDSMTGGRGMQGLLSGTTRNYLPLNWAQLQGVLAGATGTYSALSATMQSLVTANAVLTADQMAALSPAERAQVQAARNSAALLQATAQQALANTSDRFAAIQQLIDAIGSATDQKGILDLQARIAAEEGMLVNEHTKLDVLYQAAQAQEWARQQQIREQAVNDVGAFRALPPLGL